MKVPCALPYSTKTYAFNAGFAGVRVLGHARRGDVHAAVPVEVAEGQRSDVCAASAERVFEGGGIGAGPGGELDFNVGVVDFEGVGCVGVRAREDLVGSSVAVQVRQHAEGGNLVGGAANEYAGRQ